MSRYTLAEIAEQYRGKTIGIAGNGPTVIFRDQEGGVRGKADFSKYPHPLWTINGGWHYHPTSALGFLMDDLRGPSIDVHPQPAWYLNLVRDATIPVLTSKAYDDFPALVEFPLSDVMRFFNIVYFAESINYMIAFAVMIGVEKIEFFGVDYINARPQERASTEFWAGTAHGMGLYRRYLRTLASKDKKFAAALKRASALTPLGMEDTGCEIVVSPLSEMMKAKYEETYYMPGFYGYHQGSFPLEFETKGNAAHVNVTITGKFDSQWWRPVTQETAA